MSDPFDQESKLALSIINVARVSPFSYAEDILTTLKNTSADSGIRFLKARNEAIECLQGLSPKSALILHETLCDLAIGECDMLLASKRVDISSLQMVLEDMHPEVIGVGVIRRALVKFPLSGDKESLSIENVVARIILDEDDPERDGQQALFSSTAKYFGFAKIVEDNVLAACITVLDGDGGDELSLDSGSKFKMSDADIARAAAAILGKSPNLKVGGDMDDKEVLDGSDALNQPSLESVMSNAGDIEEPSAIAPPTDEDDVVVPKPLINLAELKAKQQLRQTSQPPVNAAASSSVPSTQKSISAPEKPNIVDQLKKDSSTKSQTNHSAAASTAPEPAQGILPSIGNWIGSYLRSPSDPAPPPVNATSNQEGEKGNGVSSSPQRQNPWGVKLKKTESASSKDLTPAKSPPNGDAQKTPSPVSPIALVPNKSGRSLSVTSPKSNPSMGSGTDDAGQRRSSVWNVPLKPISLSNRSLSIATNDSSGAAEAGALLSPTRRSAINIEELKKKFANSKSVPISPEISNRNLHANNVSPSTLIAPIGIGSSSQPSGPVSASANSTADEIRKPSINIEELRRKFGVAGHFKTSNRSLTSPGRDAASADADASAAPATTDSEKEKPRPLATSMSSAGSSSIVSSPITKVKHAPIESAQTPPTDLSLATQKSASKEPEDPRIKAQRFGVTLKSASANPVQQPGVFLFDPSTKKPSSISTAKANSTNSIPTSTALPPTPSSSASGVKSGTGTLSIEELRRKFQSTSKAN